MRIVAMRRFTSASFRQCCRLLSNRKCGRRTQNEYDSATPFVRGAITASPRGSAIVPWAFGFVVDFEKAA